jgi:hypothetical protein
MNSSETKTPAVGETDSGSDEERALAGLGASAVEGFAAVRSAVGPALVSWDFIVAVIAGAGLGAWAGTDAEFRRDQGTAVLLGQVPINLVLFSVALTALAIVVGLVDDFVVALLEEEGGGLRAAMQQFQIVAVVGLLGAGVSLCGAAIYGHISAVPRGFVLGLSMGITVWAGLGALSLVNLVAYFGQVRVRLLRRIRSLDDNDLRSTDDN